MNRIIFRHMLMILVASAMLYSSCTRNVQTVETDKKKDTDTVVQSFYDPQYEKEGFISKNTYRVVIVAEKNIGDSDIDTVKDQAKKRSLSSLQKYIQAQNKVVTQNTTAHLLNLIDTNGNLMKQDQFTDKHTVFFFDITKSEIKRYVDTIPQRH